jgi:ABC-type dipeptide/oligopeptide/nickel transport system permease subunit
MRRVYAHYALSYTKQPLLWVGMALGGAVALFGRWTHVSSIIENTLATPLGNVPSFLINSFLSAIERGELGTVLVVLAIASLSAVVLWQLSKIHVGSHLQAS